MPRRSKNAVVAALETTIENHVAGRIRLRRGLLGMSQSDLARTLGITFQQVQKYERGSNRVSVGKLFRLAEILDVPLTFFFDGLEMPDARPAPATGVGDDASPLLSRRELDLLRTWRHAPQDIADAVASLLRSVAPGVATEEPENGVAAAPYAEPTAAGTAKTAPLATADTALKAAAAGEPKRRGRPPKAKPAETDATAPRRRRNAVWDPSDIYRAGRKG